MMTALEFNKSRDNMRQFVLENGKCYYAFKKSGFFCKHCTDIIYDSCGPYMLMCEKEHNTSVPCWSGECEFFEPEEILHGPAPYTTTDLPDGMYRVKDGVIYKMEVNIVPDGAKVREIPKVNLQHVEYSDEELGREK